MRQTAEQAAARMMDAQDKRNAYCEAQWAKRSWLSKILWILFN